MEEENWVDAAEELRQQVASFKESARVKGIRLELAVKNGNYHAWLDCDKLEKIMSNLFTNAQPSPPTLKRHGKV